MKAFHIAMTCLLAACAVAAGQEEDTLRTRRLIHVLDGDAKPVEGASVMVVAYGGNCPLAYKQVATGTTDAAGNFGFTVEKIDGDHWPVLVTKDGMSWALTVLSSRSSGLRVVRLAEPLTLTGKVTDTEGKPVSGATVHLMTREERSGWLIQGLAPFDALVARSDEAGRFVFHGLPAGYRPGFFVTAPGMAATFPDDTYALKPFLPGQGDITITMKPEIPIPVRIVNAETGKPMAGIEFANGVGWPEVQPVISDEDGKIVIHNMGEGPFRFSENRTLSGKVDWIIDSAAIDLAYGTPTPELTARAFKGGLVNLTFVDDRTGRPVESIDRVIIAPERTNAKPQDDSPYRSHYFKSDGKGGFQTRLPAGKYKIMYLAPLGYEAIAGFAEEWVTAEAGKEASKTIPLRKLDVLRGDVAGIDGKPMPNVEICLTQDGKTETAMTESAGRFAVAVPTPKEDEDDSSEVRHTPLYLLVVSERRNLATLTTVTNVSKRQHIKLTDGTAITGLITDPDGKPLAGKVTVFICPAPAEGEDPDYDLDRRLWGYTEWADKAGRFIVPAIPKGALWDMRTSASDFAHVWTKGIADKYLIETETISLPRADKSVSGVVVGPDGKPVADARVRIYHSSDSSPAIAHTNSAGRFVAEGLAPGDVSIWTSYMDKNDKYHSAHTDVEAGDRNVRVEIADKQEP